MKINIACLSVYLGVSVLLAQDAKTPAPTTPAFKSLAPTDAIEYANFGLKIDLLTAQRDNFRMMLCERAGLPTKCIIGQKQDGEWIAVMPQDPPKVSPAPASPPAATVPLKPAPPDTTKK